MDKFKKRSFGSYMSHQVILVIALAVLVVVFGIIEPVFFKPRVFFDVFAIVGEIGLMALGLTFVITTGGIDLGVGYNLQMSGIVFGITWANTQNLALAVTLTLITGILGGLTNGLIISRTRIPPLVTTLATMYLFRGISMIIAGSNNFSGFPEILRSISTTKFFGFLPVQFIYIMVLFFILDFLYERGSLGRNLKGMGFNENAVIFSGVNTKKILLGIYTFLGLLCGMAAIIYLGRFSAAKTSMGDNMNFEVITAVLLGGTSTMGGIGSMRGTLIGIIIIGVLKKGFSLLNFSGNIYNFTLGLILILSLILFSVMEEHKRVTSR
jgi:ribose/xylose/arabinose/galactoside ABC-type transport system permease subunit